MKSLHVESVAARFAKCDRDVTLSISPRDRYVKTSPRFCLLEHEGYATNPSLYTTAEMKGLEQLNEDAKKAVISVTQTP